MRSLVLSVFAVVVSACGTPTVLQAQDYSAACGTQNGECVGVFLGDVCNPCLCNNAAISADQRKIYEADLTGAQRSCGNIAAVSCAPCENKTPVCESNTCKLQ